MPAILPPWLQASNAPQTYAAIMPEGFKLGMQADQFGREMALKGADQQNQMLRAGSELTLQSGSQANQMAMNVANLRQQQYENEQKVQLEWQREYDQIAQHEAALQQAAEQHAMEMQLKQQQIQEESLLKQHELAITDQYRKQSISLDAMKVGEARKALQFKAAQAAQEYKDRREMSDYVQGLMEQNPDMAPQEAFQRGYLRTMPRMPAGAFSAMFPKQATIPNKLDPKVSALNANINARIRGLETAIGSAQKSLDAIRTEAISVEDDKIKTAMDTEAKNIENRLNDLRRQHEALLSQQTMMIMGGQLYGTFDSKTGQMTTGAK